MTVRSSKVLQVKNYKTYSTFELLPVDDAMKEVKVFVGDSHTVHV